MQYSIVNLSEVVENDRLSAEFWNPKYLKYLNYNKQFVLIKDILKKCQYGLSRDMNEYNIGTPIYRMNEFDEIFLDKANKNAKISDKEFKEFKLNVNDVLFNRTNSFAFVGRTGILKQETDSIFASYLIRLVPDVNKVLPEYLTIYLNTNIGIQQVKRRAMESINQTNVSGSEIKKVPIFILNMNFQLIIADLVNTSYALRQSADTLYKEAEEILLEELGLKNYQPQNKKCFVKMLSDTQEAGRIDAEYFQPKYEDVIDKIKKYKGGHALLENFIENYSTGYPYKSEKYQNSGVPVIRIANIEKNKLELENNPAFISEEYSNISKKDIAKAGNILISMSGTIGNVAEIPENIKKCCINQRVLSFESKNINNKYLVLFLSSFFGYIQFERIGVGGLQINLSYNDIKNLIIPLLPQSIQSQISAKIQQSFESREKSKQLLEVAKRAVEIAIEENEEAGLKYIEENK